MVISQSSIFVSSARLKSTFMMLKLLIRVLLSHLLRRSMTSSMNRHQHLMHKERQKTLCLMKSKAFSWPINRCYSGSATFREATSICNKSGCDKKRRSYYLSVAAMWLKSRSVFSASGSLTPSSRTSKSKTWLRKCFSSSKYKHFGKTKYDFIWQSQLYIVHLAIVLFIYTASMKGDEEWK